MRLSYKQIAVPFVLLATLLLNGCGGGDDSTASTATTPLIGMVADGYLVGAKVCLDKNKNDVCDADEPFALTNEKGLYTFNVSSTDAQNFPVIVEAGADTIDLDTNQTIGKAWHFKAINAQHSFISPLTTLIAQEMEMNPSLTPELAMEALQYELGMTVSVTDDYIVKGNLQAHNAAKIVAHSLAETEQNLSASTDAEPRLIRLLAAKQVREQAEAIKTHAENNETDFVTDINTTDVSTQIAQIQTSISSTPTTTAVLSDTQKAALLFMYQEEKVARDVYYTLGNLYPSASTFANIQLSEQKHMDAVEKLCIKYGVNISGVNEGEVGVFVLPELQKLYDDLVAVGSKSLLDGLGVGIAIEEKDIKDILDYEAGMPADVVDVFENLRLGSVNHLAAFEKAYAAASK
ncbi:DUF2202 domain-containing protein [Sulfuricurvum sp.]|uniref:DUF2202 domain-containing protein n=1 Tax=Sulfuricurvum sp. TaxID=2025608 RepID=UPI003C66B888